jgi:hypothetical protein
MNIKKLFLIVCFFGCYLAAFAVDEIYKQGNYVTPHTKWLSPTPFEKKPRVLFFSTYIAGAGRYAVEMSERFDLDHQLVLVFKGKIVGGNSGAARLEDLLNQQWDAFVFFEDSPTKLLAKYPKLYSTLLFKIVRDGAGLILVDYEDAKVLKPKNKMKSPAIEPQKPLKATYYKIGKGRGVQLQGFDLSAPEYRNRYSYGRSGKALVLNYKEGWRDDYDAMFRNIGENLLWVMKKQLPALKVVADTKQVTVGGKMPSDAKLNVNIVGYGDCYSLMKNMPFNNKKQLTVKLPNLVPGKYYVNAVVRSKGKGYTFAAETLNIPKNITGDINKITFVNNDYAGDVGQKIKGLVYFSGKGNVVIRLRDTQRRILAEMPLKARKGEAPFSFEIKDWMPSMMTLEASLYNGGKEISRKYEYCNRIIRRPRMFEFSVWGDKYNQNGIHDLNCRLAELGLTTLMMPGVNVKHSPYGLQDYQLYSAHVFDTIPGNNPKNCFFSEARRKRLTDRFKKKEDSYKVGLRLVSLGDEVQEHYGCFAPGCLKEYRDFLKRKYKGDLGRLNRNWKTSFKSWSEVGLSRIPEKHQGKDLQKYITMFMGDGTRARWNHLMPHYVKWIKAGSSSHDISDVTRTYAKSSVAKRFWDKMFIDQEAGSFMAGNYARWVDRQDFKSYAYSECSRFLKDYFKGIDPYILAGAEGTGGVDFVSHADRMVDTQAWMGNYSECNYYNLMNEVSRSISPDDYISNSWVGYTTSPAMLCDRVWNEMFRRPAMIMFWTATGHGMPSYNGIVRPDLSVFTAAGEMLRQTKKMREGLGTSLLRSKSVNDPVAILYSYPSSAFGARVRHGETFDYARFSHNSVMDMIMSLGFSFRYVTNTRLENGKDNLAQYKVLILPRSCAVSNDLAKKINDFVRNGGTVIADIRAGIMDEHLNLRQPSAFDQAAGIRRKKVLPAVCEALKPSISDSKQHLESGIELAGGKAFRKTEQGIPALIVNCYGKGMFVTLNFPFSELPKMRNAPQELRQLLLDAFSKVPARTVFTLKNTGAPCWNLRRGEWKNGDMLILGVKSKPGKKKRIHAVIPAPLYVFSIDGEKSYGKVSSFDFQITPPKPEFFVLSTKPLPEITVSMPKTVKRGSTLTVTYTVKGMKGERPLRLAYERDGKPLDIQTVQEVSANNTLQQAHFRIALNELPGKYTVTARDVYTGKTTVFPITIR